MRTYGKVSLDGESLVVEAVPHVAIRVKRTFGGVGRLAVGALKIKATPASARDLAWFLTRFPMDLGRGVKSTLRDLVAAHKRMESAVDEVAAPTYVPAPRPLALPLRRYQRKAVDLALSTGRLLLADDVGLGKTPSGIGALSDPSCRPGVVVTLTDLPQQWKGELDKFLPGLTIKVPKRAVPEDADRVWLERSHPDVVLLNYAKLAGWAESLAPMARSVIFDEVQELRTGRSSAKGRGAYELSKRARLRMGLSATPIYNYGGEVWNVLDVLEPGCLGTWDEFVTEWCHGSSRHDRKASVNEPEAFGAMLVENGLVLRRTGSDPEVKDEVPELEKPAMIPHLIRLSGRELTALHDAKSAAAEYARVLLREGGNPLEKGEAAREIDHRMRQATGIAKAKAVAAFVRMLVENGEQVLLYGWHHAVYRLWAEHLEGIKCASYTGEDTQSDRKRAKHLFESGYARVLFMSLRAGAGLEGLQRACWNVVFGELDWSPGVHRQCIGRLWRPGQERRVVAWFLHADDGADPVMVDVLGLKQEQQSAIMDPGAPLFSAQRDDPREALRRLARACLEREGVAPEVN